LVVRRRSGAGLLKRRFFLFSCMRISSVQKFWGLCSFGMLWGCFCCWLPVLVFELSFSFWYRFSR
jgi:sulfite exporter TauE/SafE